MRSIVLAALLLAGCDSCKQVTGSCCKVCTDSKPCGDSCIARTQSCSAGAGCACSGFVDEVLGE